MTACAWGNTPMWLVAATVLRLQLVEATPPDRAHTETLLAVADRAKEHLLGERMKTQMERQRQRAEDRQKRREDR